MGALVGILLLLTGLFWPAPAAAQVYYWVDAEGTVHYSTGLESVPEAYRGGARLVGGAREPAGPTRIPFTPGSPIRVSAMIDGRGPVTLVLDTGADRTMISPAALARLGIAPPGTLRTRVSGVTGSSTADLVRVESVRVGDAMVGPLVLIAHDAGLPQADGLLGRDFLAAFTVTIDTRAGLVTLAPE
jgi:Aspartyl protease/Domain of unknown function (DUF4124)